MPHPVTGPLVGFASRLRFPTLMYLTLALWVLTLVIPDPLPLLDEIFFGMVTLLFATWKKRKEPESPPPSPGVTIDGESRRE